MAGYIGSKIAVTQVDGYNRTEADAEFVNDPNAVINVSGSNVGIGTSSPYRQLQVGDYSGNAELALGASTTGVSSLYFSDGDGAPNRYVGSVQYNHASNYMLFNTSGAEAMRIDSSGNLLVGTTDNNPNNNSAGSTADNGIKLGPEGLVSIAAYDNPTQVWNRTGTDGTICDIRKDGSTVGSIGVSGELFIASTASGFRFRSGMIVPVTSTGAQSDNTTDLGRTTARFQDIYATNGTIQTSDRNEKQDIEALSDAEQRVAVAAKGLLRKYRWKDAVAEKGDAARIHFGIIAQDLQAAFEAEGLDAGRYGMFISSTWWEAEVEKTREVEQEDGTTITETYTATETYDEPTEGATERTRLGVRYPELLAFIIAAL